MISENHSVVEDLPANRIGKLGGLDAFAVEVFSKRGLTEIAERLVTRSPLNPAETATLVREANIPCLAKLIELCFPPTLKPQPVKLRPVFYFPLHSLLAQRGRHVALDLARQRIDLLQRDLVTTKPLYLAIDAWHGAAQLGELLDTLSAIREAVSGTIRLEPLGLSTVELSALMEHHGRRDTEDILAELHSHGINSIEGGSDLDLHRIAAKNGFALNVSQELSLDFPEHLRGTDEGGALELSDQTHFSSEFIYELHEVRGLLSTDKLQCWFPWSPVRLESGLQESLPIAVQLLRAIAIGRLLLPEVKFIRAPLTSMGVKMAQVALEFGANDLGFAAVDADTEQALGIARLSETAQLVEEHLAVPRVII